jgi:hypothetical protein
MLTELKWRWKKWRFRHGFVSEPRTYSDVPPERHMEKLMVKGKESR